MVWSYLEPNILECEVKWALGSITMNRGSGGDGIPAELFKILKEDAVKVLHSIYQQIWKRAAAAAAASLQSCLTLCDPINGSSPGSPVPGILQARTLEWVAIFLSNAWKWKVKVKLLSHVWLFVTPLTAAHQAPPFMGFSRQAYWSRVPVPSLGKLSRVI